MATLQDVARLAGVSTATVSKVLSNTPYFTEDTREKVMRAVEALGYVPNLAARALSTGKTHIIAIVFPYVYDTIFTDPLVLRILEGIEAECSQRGYNILLSTPRLNDSGPDEHYQQLVKSGYMDGVIALDSVPMASVLEIVRKKGIPAVSIGYHPHEYTVCSDDFSGGHQLFQHVAELGHQHIGIVGVPENLHYAIARRLDGLRTAAAEAGITFDALPREDGDFSTTSGAMCAARLFDKHSELTALICLNDRMAMGVIQHVRQIGRHVPDDLTVVGYDDIPISAAFTPPLTTIDQRAVEVGQAATRTLFAIFDGQTPSPVTVPVNLVVRQSSGQVFGMPTGGGT